LDALPVHYFRSSLDDTKQSSFESLSSYLATTTTASENVQKNNFIEDELEMSRLFFLLGVIEKLVIYFPLKHLKLRLLPLLYLGIQNSNMHLNKFSHNIYAALFESLITSPSLISNSLKETILIVIPSYIKLSLENYPSLTPMDAFQESMSAICRSLSGVENAATLSLSCLKQLDERIHFFLSKGSPRLSIVLCLFKQISNVSLDLMDDLLVMARNVVTATSCRPVQQLFCKMLLDCIAENFDYSRKDRCLKWYLQLLSDLNMLEEDIMPVHSSSVDNGDDLSYLIIAEMTSKKGSTKTKPMPSNNVSQAKL